MTEVGHADLSRLLQSKRNECNAIVTSRKRKLRELFAVATQVETLPNDAFANPDAPVSIQAEWQFLQANDILQGKTLNELNIPTRSQPSLDKLKKSLAAHAKASSTPAADSTNAPPSTVPETKSNDGSVLKNGDSKLEAPSGSTPASSATATPVLAPRHQSNQPASPLYPTKPDVKSPVDVEHASSAKGTPNGTPQPESATVQRQTQVKFPPGTKKSLDSESARSPSAARADGATDGALSIKLPGDSTKAADALSSPASTAHTATTPAVHDVSTDTSPDNDGTRYMDDAERKAEHIGDSEKQQKDKPEQDQSSSAQDQLLQESIRTDASAVPAASAEPTAALKPSATSDQQLERIKGNLSNKPAETEVPDSQSGSPEAMDVDAPDQTAQTTQTPQETTRPTGNTVAASSPLASTPKEQTPRTAERAVTRVSSGAMRLKSVTEIVGGGATSRSGNASERESTIKGTHDQLTPVTSTPQSPAAKTKGGHKRDRSKGQISTVLFGKQPKRADDKAVVPGHKETLQASDDYYTPLFVQNFTGANNWMQPLERILFQANKTIATPDANLVIQDHQACRVLRRVYHLQQHDKWSLRQLKRCPEPTRPPTQWDVLMKEMKWMRTDFREERKWKMAVARNLAYACAIWHDAAPDERKEMQVAAVIPPKQSETSDNVDITMADAGAEGDTVENQPTPDLIPSGDMDSPQAVDELTDDFVETVAPSAIFTLQEYDVVFGLRRTTASDALLDELPMYGSPLKVPKCDITGPEYDPDAHWRRAALPLSKYVEGEMKLLAQGPPRKRSRFNYENEESDDERDSTFVADQAVHHVRLPPSTDEVALFHPESKNIRDRLHAGHQFRPPSEHQMPVQSFYECRGPSQWTVTEDDELRGLVREYSYNWSLISSMLSTKSRFASGAERRTPWECFERWINLEGLPADMQKTQYFKAYNSRIESAQRVIAQQNQLAAQQASAAGNAVTPVRRRPSTPLRVERRRAQKHLTLLDAMRKLAKKRETTIQKQQHSASQNSANKKTNDTIAQRPKKTPRDYSLLRWERDQALAEKMAQYAQRQEAQRRAALQARVQGQAAQAAAAAGAGGAAQAGNHLPGNNNANSNVATGAGPPNIPSQLAAAAAAAAAIQGRPRMPMQTPGNNGGVAGVQGQMNGGLSAPSQMAGIPQAQMQAALQAAQHRMPMPNQQPDANLMLRAQRISQQQRVQIQQAQQQGQHLPQQQQQGQQGQPQGQPMQQQGSNGSNGVGGQHSSPPMRNGMNGINQQAFMNTAQAMMATYNTAAQANGHTSPPTNGGLHMPSSIQAAGSPGQRVHPQLPPGIAAQLAQLEAQFRAKNANLTPEQARQLATEHLTRAMMAQRQSAMNAAAGAAGQGGLANSIAATTSPHQYAALLRQQQQQQAALQAQQAAQQQQRAGSQASPTPGPAGSPAQSHQRQSSGSATPGAK